METESRLTTINPTPPLSLSSVKAQLNELQTDPCQSQALLTNLIDSALDAILVLDAHHRILLVNPAAEGLFLIDADEMLGKPIGLLISSDLFTSNRGKMDRIQPNRNHRDRLAIAQEGKAKRSTGEIFPVDLSISTFHFEEKQFFTAIVRDISTRKKVEAELRRLSTHDALTGLYNRFFFEEELSRLGRGRPPYPITIMIADVDGLKNINDRYGHLSGDDLIKNVATILKSTFRTEDIVARLGGDEFGIILQNTNNRITESTIQRIHDRLWLLNRDAANIPVAISIGVANYQEGESLDETIRRADRAMYQHKTGKSHKKRL